jgi:DNA replication protein DnaC
MTDVDEDVIETVDRPATGDVDRLWRDAPIRFSNAHADDLDTSTLSMVEECLTHPTRNLLVLGSVGVGKTHTALAAARAWLDHYERAWWFTPVPNLLAQLRPSAERPNVVLNQALTVPLLVLDDLGGERSTEWTLEWLYIIINQRWLDQRPTIATSNLAVERGQGPLPDAIGVRTYSRLVQDATTIELAGADLRRAQHPSR